MNQPDARKSKILAIDDEPSIRDLIGLVLEEQYQVLTASSGIEGIRMAKAETPDLILLDILMPGHDGIACLHELRAIPETSRLPILMLTALNDVTTRIKAFNAGADDFISKPFRPDELLARIQAKLTRVRELSNVTPMMLRFGDVELDLMQARVVCGREEISINATEFRILSILLRKRGNPITEGELRDSVFAFNPAAGYVLASYISSVEDKLAPSNVRLISFPGKGLALGLRTDVT